MRTRAAQAAPSAAAYGGRQSAPSRRGLPARLPLPGARGADRRTGPGGRVHPGVRIRRRDQPADEAGVPAATPRWWTPTCSPILARYVDQVAGEPPGVRVLFYMQINGGLADACAGSAARTVSCPVLAGGGIVGMARSSAVAGFWPGARPRAWAARPPTCRTSPGSSSGSSRDRGGRRRPDAGRRCSASTPPPRAAGRVACRFDGSGGTGSGPDSAGASANEVTCYRHGGPLTVTDANLMLGRIRPGYFPRVFGPDGDQPAWTAGCHRAALRGTGTARSARLTGAWPQTAPRWRSRLSWRSRWPTCRATRSRRSRCSAATTPISPGTCWPLFRRRGLTSACAVADQLGMTTGADPPAGRSSGSAYGGMGLADVTAMRGVSRGGRTVPGRHPGRRRRPGQPSWTVRGPG